MSSRQHEACLLVLGQGESRWPIAVQRVALLTAVEIRSSGELSLVFVFVAVEAAREFDFIKCFPAFRDMALRTLYRGVLGFQRVSGRGVLFDTEFRGFEALYRVAGGAFSTVCTLEELPLVLVFMAIHTPLEGDRLFEITSAVALQAIDRLVLAKQGIPGSGMIKALIEGGCRDPFPPASVVARLAALLSKAAMVRVGMAVGTLGKGQANVSRLVARSRRVTFLARHLGVHTGQRIARSGVVELPTLTDAGNLPVVVVVALQTVLTQPALVLILVAGHAAVRNSQKSLVQVFELDTLAFRP
jgi:hypothetical protein